MKKIIHIIDNLTLGGAETLLFATIKRFPQFKHHVVLLNDKIHIAGFENYAQLSILHHAGWHTAARTCKRLRHLVNEVQPDVVHAHLFLSSLLSRWALGTRYNLVYSIHNLFSAMVFKKWWLRLSEKATYNPKHKLITVSKYVLDDYQSVVTACRTGHVLYNFIDDAFINDGDLKKLRPPAALHKWVAVGSFKAQKNYQGLIRLFETFYKDHSEKECLSLDIYGDGPLRPAMEEQIRRAALPIYLKGRVENVSSLLKDYDAYISTSSYEGYGIAPMEAIAIGIPVFLNAIPVYREIYNDHGFFFDVDEPGATSFLNAYTQYESMAGTAKQVLSESGQQYAAAVAGSHEYLKRLLSIYGIHP